MHHKMTLGRSKIKTEEDESPVMSRLGVETRDKDHRQGPEIPTGDSKSLNIHFGRFMGKAFTVYNPYRL